MTDLTTTEHTSTATATASCNADSNNRCVNIITNKQKTKILLVKEKITHSRLKEWLSWYDKPIDIVYDRLSNLSIQQIKNLPIPLHIMDVWVQKKENKTVSKGDFLEWFKQDGLFIPDRIYQGLGKWGCPKGHLKYNENPIKGTRREIYEELGIHIPFHRLKCLKKYNSKDQKKYVFYTSIDENKPLNIGDEIEDYDWFPVYYLLNNSGEKHNSSIYYIRRHFKSSHNKQSSVRRKNNDKETIQ